MISLRSIKASWPSAQSWDGYYATPSQLVTSRSVNWRDPTAKGWPLAAIQLHREMYYT